jgi:hypothetical protein
MWFITHYTRGRKIPDEEKRKKEKNFLWSATDSGILFNTSKSMKRASSMSSKSDQSKMDKFIIRGYYILLFAFLFIVVLVTLLSPHEK